MVWYGMVWYGMVSHGMAWYGFGMDPSAMQTHLPGIWFGLLQFDLVSGWLFNFSPGFAWLSRKTLQV